MIDFTLKLSFLSALKKTLKESDLSSFSLIAIVGSFKEKYSSDIDLVFVPSYKNKNSFLTSLEIFLTLLDENFKITGYSLSFFRYKAEQNVLKILYDKKSKKHVPIHLLIFLNPEKLFSVLVNFKNDEKIIFYFDKKNFKNAFNTKQTTFLTALTEYNVYLKSKNFVKKDMILYSNDIFSYLKKHYNFKLKYTYYDDIKKIKHDWFLVLSQALKILK